MKLVIFACLVALAAAAEETYTTDNDDIDIEAVVSNLDTLKSFYGCFVGQSSCNEVQADFKKDIPEAVQQACAKCTIKQKHIFKKFLEGLKEKLPENYTDFKKKFDPEGKYFLLLETAVANA